MPETLDTTVDYRHGVDVGSTVALRVMRKLGVSDEVFASVARAVAEIRESRPLYGAAPIMTAEEGEIFRAQMERRFSSGLIPFGHVRS